MGLFDKSKKEKKEETGLESLLNIPYDYNGYDVVFSQGHTKPELYNEISLIISNSKYDIKKLKEFNSLNIDSSIDEFYEFYDIWTGDLINENFMVYLDNDVSMEEFANKIIEILDKNEYKTDITAEMLVKEYKDYLLSINLSDTFKYDVLEANIVAWELRKYNMELIALFNGFGNTEIAIIQASRIEKLKELESKISN